MTRKLLKICGIGILFTILFFACRADNDGISHSKNKDSKYVSRSLWKEDEVYIKNVMKIYEENEIELKKKGCTPLWNYAITSGYFDESYLKVPISKNDVVIGILQVKRQKDINKVYFYYDENQNEIDFFQTLIFDKRHKKPFENVIKTSDPTNKMTTVECVTTSFEVGCFSNQSGCIPMVKETTTCTVSHGDGGGGGDGNGGGGYDYPPPPPHGGGGNIGDNSSTDPCANADANNVKAKDMLTKPKVALQKTEIIKTLKTDTIEKSFQFGIDDKDEYVVSEIVNGSSGTAPMASTNPSFTVIGGMHTHDINQYNVASGGDIYKFHANHKDNNKYNYYYTFSNGNNNYVYTIVDQTKFDTFIKDYPATVGNFDLAAGNWNETSVIGKAFVNILGTFADSGMDIDIQYELTMAAMISKFDMGIALAKEDANGDFKGIYVNEVKDTADTTKVTYTKTTDCNLKN